MAVEEGVVVALGFAGAERGAAVIEVASAGHGWACGYRKGAGLASDKMRLE